MTIIQKKTADLIPYEKNPRKNDEAVEKVAASIREFGFKVPIVIDKDNVIVAGHTRLKAAEAAGMDEVPCIVADDLTDEQIKAFRLADNKTAEFASWDFDLLTGELQDITDIDMSEFGFDFSEIDEEEEIIEDDYDFKENVEHRATAGDVFQLGEHRLMCGDSSSPDDVEKLSGGVRAKMVFTDPPYGVAIGDKNKMLQAVQRAGRQTENIIGDTLGPQELYELLKKVFINLREHSAEDCSYYVTAPQGGDIGLMMMMKDAGLEVRHNLIWEKNTATFSMRRLDYDYQHEPIFYTWTKKHNYYGKGQYHTTIWKFDKPRKCDLHPTMKPIELVAEALLNSSLPGDPVFDFFGGSGTTLMACEQLKRKCFMMEKDPKFVDVILDRWEQFTGKKAEKLTDEEKDMEGKN